MRDILRRHFCIAALLAALGLWLAAVPAWAQWTLMPGRAKDIAAETDVAKLTGEELARLHHTHGVDPSMLEAALMLDGRAIPQRLHDDYQRAYSAHRATGGRGFVREIIVAKTK